MERRNEIELQAKLPKSMEAIQYKAAARAFYHCLLRGDDPFSVIDEMIVHYEKQENRLQKGLEAYIQRYGPMELEELLGQKEPGQ